MTLIDIDGGRRLAIASAGEGWPTVFLETGLGAESAEWGAVQAGVARFTRVARYDRAGRGESAAAPARGARTLDELVADLHALLHTPGLREGACVLVGHSFGGLVVRRYAQRHARDVAALVLVDAMHEQQFDRLGPCFPAPGADDGPVLQGMRAFWRDGWRDPANNAEGLDFAASFAQLGPDALALPRVVLSAGGFLDAKVFARAAGRELQRHWLELQGALAAAARPVEHLYVETSGHFMQRDTPQVIVDALERLVARLRAR